MPGVRTRSGSLGARQFDFERMPLSHQDRLEAWKKNLAEPYRGVVTRDGIVPGLFPLRATGISVTPAVAAARDYLAALSDSQITQGIHDIAADSWRQWSNHARFYMRHGICLADLTESVRSLALELLRQSLSPKGYFLARDVMRSNYSLWIISGHEDDLDEWLYWLTIYGEPSETGAWGWQIDGHHLNLNCAFIADQIVLTPMLVGAEPVWVDTGPYAGIRLFRFEESDALSLMRRLDDSQRRKALIADELPSDLFTGAFRDNVELNYQGIEYAAMLPEQQQQLVDLLLLYVTRMRRGHAEEWQAQITDHLDELHFAWAGGTGDDSVFYYRIHSPVILVEFEHQPGVVFNNDAPSRAHIHTVVRTPNGNDYGKDVLRQHHEAFHSGKK